MLKKILLLALVTVIAGCAGIPFCDQNGQPKGCHKWDPATTSGAAAR